MEVKFKKIPPFYVAKTLLGMTPDRNRISLYMPGDRSVVLRDMGAPREDWEIKLWNELAQKLSEVWEEFDERGRANQQSQGNPPEAPLSTECGP